MASSMNNWLGFSLSPQEQQIPHHEQQQQLIPEQPHGAGDCFDLSSADDSTMQLPSLNNLPAHAPFGILEAFKTNHNSHSSSPQDWNWKEVSTNYKNSLLMERSSCNSNNIPSPKLENFLGGRSFSTTDHHQNHNPNSTIGLSMIKNWLRNNPAAQPEETINDQYFNATAETMNFSGGATTQNLSLSMSTGSQSTAASALPLLTGGGGGSSDGDNGAGDQMSSSSENKQPPSSGAGMGAVGGGGLDAQSGAIEAVPRKSIDTFGQRTSIYRGVTRHRWTGRYEAHLWDNSCRREGQTRKGRQVYLGGYDKEEKAARAYDLAALKYWGTTTTTNFPISNYEKEVEEMKHMTRQEYVASLRRKSSGFSRGASIYRGVTRHHQHGRWQARIGRVAGNKDLYLGTFSTQEEAAEAYDIAAIKFRGLNAVTNFEINRYDVKSILESSTLPIGGAAKRLKDAEMLALDAQRNTEHNNIIASHLAASDHHGILNSYSAASPWPTTTIAFQQQAQPLTMQYHPYGGGGGHQQRLWCKQENDNNSFQDFHQLQVGNTHNFLQPSVLHNLMSLDSASSGENGSSYHNQGVGYGSNVHLPMSSSAVQEEEGKHIGYENNMYVSSSSGIDHEYHNSGRNSLYNYHHHHHLQQQGSWVPTAVPALAARANSLAAVCHGSSPFTVWNDT